MDTKSGSSATTIHRCDICKKQYSTKQKLKEHRKTHLPKTDFKCSFCEFITNFKTVLHRHVRSRHTQERPYKCSEPNCNSTFNDNAALHRHKLVHNKDESLLKYKCSDCCYKTKAKGNLKIHMKTHSNIAEFSCDLCPYRAKQKDNLETHRKSVHFNWKRYKCQQPDCNYACSHKSVLTKHELLCHENINGAQNVKSVQSLEKPFKCVHPNCNYSCTEILELNNHTKVHDVASNKDKESGLYFKCSKCPFKTESHRLFNRHLRLHLNAKPFSCDLCPYRTKRTGHLKRHVKSVHSSEKPLKCAQPNCNYSCKEKSELNRHQRVHVADKPHSCPFPGCTFKTKGISDLRSHQKVHCKEKPFKCSFCKFRSKHKGSLKSHIRRHTGEAPYSCPNCSYCYKTCSHLAHHLRKCNLRKGQRTASNEEEILSQNASLQCKSLDCGYSTSVHLNMATHYNVMHKLPRVELVKLQ